MTQHYRCTELQTHEDDVTRGQEANRYLSAGTLSTASSLEAPLVIRSWLSTAWNPKSIHSHIGCYGSVSNRLLM